MQCLAEQTWVGEKRESSQRERGCAEMPRSGKHVREAEESFSFLGLNSLFGDKSDGETFRTHPTQAAGSVEMRTLSRRLTQPKTADVCIDQDIGLNLRNEDTSNMSHTREMRRKTKTYEMRAYERKRKTRERRKVTMK
jgi:hypothetical protein